MTCRRCRLATGKGGNIPAQESHKLTLMRQMFPDILVPVLSLEYKMLLQQTLRILSLAYLVLKAETSGKLIQDEMIITILCSN